MRMYSHFLNKGHSLDKLINLSYLERQFYIASMSYDIENKSKEISTMFGGE